MIILYEITNILFEITNILYKITNILHEITNISTKLKTFWIFYKLTLTFFSNTQFIVYVEILSVLWTYKFFPQLCHLYYFLPQIHRFYDSWTLFKDYKTKQLQFFILFKGNKI